MLPQIIIFLSLGIASVDETEALRLSATPYLTYDQAKEHYEAAKQAALIVNAEDIDAELLLGIAWFESRYAYKVVSKEPQGKISCGVMTPEPTYDWRKCNRTRGSLYSGYLAGAQHLKMWIDACAKSRNERGARPGMTCALRGYAGGWALIKVCEYRTWYVRKGVDACRVPQSRMGRASLIRDYKPGV